MNEFEIKDGVLYKYNGKDVSIVVPDGITVIGEAFLFDLNLEEIVLPSCVQEINTDAFLNCLSLKKVKLSLGLIKIGDRAFLGSAIEKIVIPCTVNYIGELAFSQCKNLAEVSYGGSKAEWKEIKFGGDECFRNSPVKKVRCTDGTVSVR